MAYGVLRASIRNSLRSASLPEPGHDWSQSAHYPERRGSSMPSSEDWPHKTPARACTFPSIPLLNPRFSDQHYAQSKAPARLPRYYRPSRPPALAQKNTQIALEKTRANPAEPPPPGRASGKPGIAANPPQKRPPRNRAKKRVAYAKTARPQNGRTATASTPHSGSVPGRTTRRGHTLRKRGG